MADRTHPDVLAVIQQAFAAKDEADAAKADAAKVDRDEKKTTYDASEGVLSSKTADLQDKAQKAISLLQAFLVPGVSDPESV